MKKRIGRLTGGGDRGGLSAVTRAAELSARSSYGWGIVGVRDGSMGLLRTAHGLGICLGED